MTGVRRRAIPFANIAWVLLLACSAFRSPAQSSPWESGSAEPTPAPLTTISAVRALTADEADRHRPATIRGIVTRCTNFEIYIQDETGAMFVGPDLSRPLYRPLYELGDVIEVTGVTAAGHYLPILLEKRSRLLGKHALPTPKVARYTDLATGGLDCFWVEVSGVIRSLEINSTGTLSCRLAIDGRTLQVEMGDPEDRLPKELIGATVRVRGVAGGLKNFQRQLVQPIIWVAVRDDTFELVSPAPDRNAARAQPIATLMAHDSAKRRGPLWKIAGQVTWAESPRLIYVRDTSGSVEAQLQANAEVHEGDHVEVVGFAELRGTKPLLVDGFAKYIAGGPLPMPHIASVRELLEHNDDADLVEIDGLVTDVSRTSQAVTLTMDQAGSAFQVVYTRHPGDEIADLPEPGSRLVIVGVCQIERLMSSFSSLANAVSLSIRLRTLEDIRVIKKPSWWTTRRLAYVVGGLTVGLMLAFVWIRGLRRTVALQTETIIAKTRNQATAEERARIAREFHDSLEQRLAGATMVLDAAASALPRRVDVAGAHIDTARAMLRHGLDEAQRAVLNLRNHEYETDDFATVLERAMRSMIGAQPVALAFSAAGPMPVLDAVAQNHVVRVGQEAVTNALKHGNPKNIRATLTATPENVTLRVEDDGQGANGTAGGQAAPGQFGLIGMRERAEKLRGTFSFDSKPARGTVVELCFPNPVPKKRSRRQTTATFS